MTATTTTPVRPRPAVPARPPAAKPADAGAGTGRMIAWLRLYWLTILFCGGLLGTGLAYVAWSLLASKYESYALLRVASAQLSVSNTKDPNRSRTDFTTYLKTSAGYLKNEFVLDKALSMEMSDGVRICNLPTIKEQKNPFQFLEDELVVGYQDGDERIKISMKGHNPEDIQHILNAVQQAFMKEVIEKELEERRQFLAKLNVTVLGLQKQLNDRAGKPNEPVPAPDGKAPKPLGQDLIPAAGTNATGPPEWMKKELALNLVKESIALRNQINNLPVAIASQKATLDLLKKHLDAAAAPAPQTGPTAEMVAAAIDRDPDVKALEYDAKTARYQYNLDSSRVSNPNVPSITAKKERADRLAKELADLKQKKRDLYSQMRIGPNGTLTSDPALTAASPKVAEYEKAALELQRLENELTKCKATLTTVVQELVKLPPDAETLKPVDFRGRRDDEKRWNPDSSFAESEDAIFRGLVQNAAALRLDIDSPKRVTVLQTASTPMQKDTKKQLLGTGFAFVLGFAFVGLIAVGYEMRTQKTCGLADVKAAVTAPVVGVVPWLNDASLRDPIRRAEVREGVDKLRTYVTQGWLSRGATTVTVTSPHTDEGKAFTAFALANSLAEAGYKTLLIDFDLRTPSLHTFANLENAAGVCELLRGEADFQATIKLLPNALHVLPAGKWSDDARRAAGSGRLEQLLTCLREPFDCVILHSHPLLAAAESIEVARRSEVVLLCTLCRETTLPLLKKAGDRLNTMEVPFSGIVYLGATPQEALC